MKFSELELHPALQRNIERVNYVECTPIQSDAIPHVLKGRDIAGLAQTGTGKTAAFLVPLIDRILRGIELGDSSLKTEPQANANIDLATTANDAEVESENAAPTEVSVDRPRYFQDWKRRQYVLILVPTRELAEQVFENAERLLDSTGLKAVAVYGGTTYEKQKAAFTQGVEFVIATPGRLIDLYKENIADLRQVRAVVFDEADRMFDMGFKDDMKFILKRIPRERQFLVFSATLNFDVLNTAYEFGAYPVEINISKDVAKAENVTDELLHIGQFDKPKFLLSLIKKNNPRQAIIFSNFKHSIERIARFLSSNGVPAVGISSLLTQAQRNRVMAQFKAENDQNILVATDVAARGLDILGVDLVMNYELPDDPENYVHRIGRTGRAGHKGHAISLVSDRDVDALSRIEEYLGHKVPIGWLDDKELVTEMKPFPMDSDRTRGAGGPRGEKRFDRGSGRGGRGGGRNDRGDRGDRGHSGGDRERNHGSRRDGESRRPHHAAGGQSGGGSGGGNFKSNSGPKHASANGRPSHRSHHGQSDSANQNSNQGQNQNPRHQGHRTQQDGKNKSMNGGHRRPHHQQNAKSRRIHRHGSGSNTRTGAQSGKPGTAPASIGQKVTGFFKKLFGAKS